MPWKTLCKHRTALPWGLGSIISSSSVIYIPAPLCCGKREGETFFFFPFNCRSPDTLTCIISISQKKDFLPLLFKNEISRREQALLQLLSLQTMFTLQEGGRWKARATLFQVPEKGAAVFEKEQQYSPYRYHSVRPLMGGFSKRSEGIRRWLLWSPALGCSRWHWLGEPALAPGSVGGRRVQVARWMPLGGLFPGTFIFSESDGHCFIKEKPGNQVSVKGEKGEGWILCIYDSWEQNWSLDPEFKVGSSWWYQTR